MAVPSAFVTWATGSSVAVAVGASVAGSVGTNDGMGVNTAAVNVNCETTVLAAEVRTAATSGVGSGVVADPQACRICDSSGHDAGHVAPMRPPEQVGSAVAAEATRRLGRGRVPSEPLLSDEAEVGRPRLRGDDIVAAPGEALGAVAGDRVAQLTVYLVAHRPAEATAFGA